MPELPEVETIRRDLESSILNKTFKSIEVVDPFILRSPLKDFIQSLKNQSVTSVIRRGKALMLWLSDGKYLLVHLMMTGQMVVGSKPHKHSRIIFTFTDGTQLLYNDQRRFGQLSIVKDLSKVNYLNILGPEPLEKGFSGKFIFDQTRGRKRPIKNVLLDHTFVAGIGNIYACEILYRARINPARLATHITLAEAKDIHGCSVNVLKKAIRLRGSSIRNYRDGQGQKGTFNQVIAVYGKEGNKCSECKTVITRIVQAGRSTFYCSKCQK